MTEIPRDSYDMPDEGRGQVDSPLERMQDLNALNTSEDVEFGPLQSEGDWMRKALEMQRQKALLGRVIRSRGMDPDEDADYLFLSGRLSMAKDQVIGFIAADAIDRLELGEEQQDGPDGSPLH